MPIYEYKCVNCGNRLEAMQKISDQPLVECPSCQGKLEKQWSLSGFQFKGSGWYVSDYSNRGKESKSAEPNSPSGDTTQTSAGGDSATNVTPAAKTETKPAKTD